MSSAATSATRESRSSTTPSSRCSSGTRRMATTSRPPTTSSCSVSEVAERVLGTTKIERDGAEIELAPPWRRETWRDRERTPAFQIASTRPARAGGVLREGDGDRARPQGGLGQARRRPALEEGRARADPADLHHRLPGRALPLRQAPPQRGGSGRALGGLRRRDGDCQLLQRAKRPRRGSAAASRCRRRSWPAATRRRSPSTRRSSRRSSRACRRPAASCSASNWMVMMLTG